MEENVKWQKTFRKREGGDFQQVRMHLMMMKQWTESVKSRGRRGRFGPTGCVTLMHVLT